MRRPVDADRLDRFLTELGRAGQTDVRVYLTGGACAVLKRWRNSTLDIDLKVVPEDGALLAALPRLKESLEINVELAAPDQFIPELPGWQERSPLIRREGRVEFRHYDFASQALAKIERGHAQDLADVAEMARRSLVSPTELPLRLEEIAPRLHLYPAVDPASFRRAVEQFVEKSRDL